MWGFLNRTIRIRSSYLKVLIFLLLTVPMVGCRQVDTAKPFVLDKPANSTSKSVILPVPSNLEQTEEINVPEEQIATQNVNSEPISQPVQVAEGKTLLQEKTKEVTVSLWQVKGNLVNDPEPGPMQGTFRFGEYDLVAEDGNGKEFGRFRINDAFHNEELAFRQLEPFALQFDDYNADGEPDFTIGQRAGSNGSLYALLSLGMNGFKLLEADIYSADSRSSIQYPKTEEGMFINTYYDMDNGRYMEVVRKWVDDAFKREEATVLPEGRPAGIAD